MRRKNDMNLWWGMWWVAVSIFFLGLVCILTGCGDKSEEETTETDSANRFSITYSQDFNAYSRLSILHDSETNRDYLYMKVGNSGGLALMPNPGEEVTFTGETEPMVFSSTLPETPAEPEPVVDPEPVDTEPKLKSIGTFKVTAYCACVECCEKDPSDPWYGITATGTRATQGRTIAVDKRVIPYGTTVYFDGIEGFGGYVAEDCGGAIDGKDIDLYFDTHEEAEAWGVKQREVFVMKEAA